MKTSSIKNGLLLFTLIIALYAASMSTWRELKPNRIAYVNSSELLEQYEGARLAREQVEGRMKAWNENITTLEEELKALNEQYQQQRPRLTDLQQEEKEQELRAKHQEYLRYKQSVQQKAQELELELTQPVLDELNQLIADYGKQKGYRVILGTLNGGNILYGEDAADITEDILHYANNRS